MEEPMEIEQTGGEDRSQPAAQVNQEEGEQARGAGEPSGSVTQIYVFNQSRVIIDTPHYDISFKLYIRKEGKRDEDKTQTLLEEIRRVLKADAPEKRSLLEIIKDCDVTTVFVEQGCVKVTFRFNSKEGLQKFWDKYSSGELLQRMKTDFPIEKVDMSADDYKRGCDFFEGNQIQDTIKPEAGQLQGAARSSTQGIPKCLAQDKLLTLAKKLGTQGSEFGIRLGFQLTDLVVFDKDSVRDPVQATWKMLVKYTEKHPDTDLVGKFVKELKATDRVDLALELQAEAEPEADLQEQQAEAEAAVDLR